GGADMKMREIQEAASLIQEQAHEDANIIFGASIDENMGEVLKVTVIATGFDRAAEDSSRALEARAFAPRGAPRESVSSVVPARVESSAPVPALVRRGTGARGLESGRPESGVYSSPIDTDWDIPAYQRRQSTLP